VVLIRASVPLVLQAERFKQTVLPEIVISSIIEFLLDK
jgi:hypothetical protein